MNATQPNPVGKPPRDGKAMEGHIHLRVSLHRKSAWVRHAKPRKLAEAITIAMDKESGYKAPQT